jgi:hypothetical protein
MAEAAPAPRCPLCASLPYPGQPRSIGLACTCRPHAECVWEFVTAFCALDKGPEWCRIHACVCPARCETSRSTGSSPTSGVPLAPYFLFLAVAWDSLDIAYHCLRLTIPHSHTGHLGLVISACLQAIEAWKARGNSPECRLCRTTDHSKLRHTGSSQHLCVDPRACARRFTAQFPQVRERYSCSLLFLGNLLRFLLDVTACVHTPSKRVAVIDWDGNLDSRPLLFCTRAEGDRSSSMLVPWMTSAQISILAFQSTQGAATACETLTQHHGKTEQAALQFLYL